MNKYMKILVVLQAVLVIGVLSGVYFLYPKISMNVEGTVVNFQRINANVIIISENPDFSNPRYLDFEGRDNISFSLKPGTYYWKASNEYLEGLKKDFTIDSEVGMKVEVDEKGSKLINVGNVILSVIRNKEGVMVGHIILEPNSSEEIENSGEYVGGQA